jgi:hypothetical protein
MMAVWKLLPIADEGSFADGPRSKPYTESQGFVVVATDEREARKLAQAAACLSKDEGWWIDPAITSCESVDGDGPSHVVMADTPTG